MHHGVMDDVEKIGQLVVCRPHGAFNMDGVKEYEESFVELVTPLMNHSWGILNVYIGFETGGPDVIKRIRSQYLWCAKNGCEYMAFYTVNPLQAFFARQTVKEVGFKKVKFFDDEQEAQEWIEQKLVDANQ